MEEKFDDIKAVFIGGCPRSGTTMLGSILGAAPGCVVTPESQFKQTIPSIYDVDWNHGLDRKDFISALKKSIRFRLWGIPVPNINLPDILKPEDYRKALFSLVHQYADAHGKNKWHIWIDHTPLNIQQPLVLMKLFPGARFIYIVRDPRAVAASVLPLDWGPHSAGGAALFWAQRNSYGQALERVHPDKCIKVYYEDILAAPEKTIKKVCDFCGIKYVSSILSGGGFSVPRYTKKQHKLVGLMPDESRIDAWQQTLSIWQIAEVERNVGDLMELMGYKRFVINKSHKRKLTKRLAYKTLSLYYYLKKVLHFKKKFYY